MFCRNQYSRLKDGGDNGSEAILRVLGRSGVRHSGSWRTAFRCPSRVRVPVRPAQPFRVPNAVLRLSDDGPLCLLPGHRRVVLGAVHRLQSHWSMHDVSWSGPDHASSPGKWLVCSVARRQHCHPHPGGGNMRGVSRHRSLHRLPGNPARPALRDCMRRSMLWRMLRNRDLHDLCWARAALSFDCPEAGRGGGIDSTD